MAANSHLGRVGLVMVGDELLDGRTFESNSHFLIENITKVGGRVGSIRVVADDVARVSEAIRAAWEDSVAVVVTGGLGPTPDDLTREALAAFTGEALMLDETLADELVQRYQRRGREMARSNLRQAWRTPSARPIPNRRGTAPGLMHLLEGVPVLLLPGVPSELVQMWEDTAAGIVAPLVQGGAPNQLRLRTARVPESDLADRVATAGLDPSVETLFCVTRFGVDLVLRAPSDRDDLTLQLSRLVEELKPQLYAVGEAGLHRVVVEELIRRKQTLAVAESCTGGLLGGSLTEVPGSSQVFKGGVIAYDNAVKASWLGVSTDLLESHGAVSGEIAAAMAQGVANALDCTWALAVTGIAGPSGGLPNKPVGTVWVGLSGPGGVRTELSRFPGDREQNRQWSVAAALDLLRRALDIHPQLRADG